MHNMSSLIRLAQGAFAAAVVFTFYSAVAPPARTLHMVPWDKAQHFIAFYVLTGMAAAAFPRRQIVWIAVCLSGFGALIEVVQAMPIVNRDSDFWDWVADTVAIAAALGPMLLVWWRNEAQKSAVTAAHAQKNMDR